MGDWRDELIDIRNRQWQSWSNPGLFAHPDSPAGGGGAGGFRQAGPVLFAADIQPDSPAGFAYGPWLVPPVAADAGPPSDSSFINRILKAADSL